MIGQQLNHYEIVRCLGAGGMGEVYEARDTRLGRQVALKILPAEMAANVERRTRFEREARAVAALNHPGIVTVYSVEDSEGLLFITMELIEGQTLGELVGKHGLEQPRLLEIAAQLVDALSVAHAAGITHRDLKPDNVMLTAEGRVKILDFGLAKPTDAAGADDRTLLRNDSVTQAGEILGTVAYMSPEQAQGLPVDHRSDIFSFGVLLYEAASGQRPFIGDNNVSVISAILKDDPAPLPGSSPAMSHGLQRVVRRCLAKRPEDRYQSTLDLRHDVRELLDSRAAAPPLVAGASRQPFTPATPDRRPAILAAAALAVAAVAIAWALLSASSAPPPRPFQPTLTQVTDFAGSQSFPSLSPDGRQVVYAESLRGRSDIHLLRIGGDNPINLTSGSDADDTHPAFSPDGETIAFRSERQGGGIFLMGATGESVRRLTDFGFHPAWSPDGRRIAFSTDNIDEPAVRTTRAEVWIVDVETGETARVVGGDASQPSWSPDGTRIAYWGLFAGSGQRDLWSVATDGSDPIRLTDDQHLDWNPIWSPDGRHLYFASDRGGSRDLWRLPVELPAGRATGPPEAVTAGAANITHPTISASGERLALVSQSQRSRIQALPFDPDSERIVGPAEPVLESAARLNTVWLSEDGEWLLYWAAKKSDTIRIDRVDGTERRVLVQDEFRNRTPAWCENDRTVLFGSDRGGRYEIWSIGADGGGLQQLTTDTPSRAGAMVPICASDSDTVYYAEMGEGPVAGRFENGEIVERRQMTDLRDLPEFGPDSAILFWDVSRDRSKLVGSLWETGTSAAIVVYSVATGELRTADFARAQPLGGAVSRWLSDNRRAVFVEDGALKILDSATMEMRDVARIPEVLNLADVSNDDRRILAISISSNDDIWTVDLD